VEEFPVDNINNYIHLFSGGLDSTYSLFKLTTDINKNKAEKHNIQPLHIDYGQFAASSEWISVNNVIEFLRSKLDSSDFLLPPTKMNLKSELFTWCDNVAFTGKEKGDETCEIYNRNMVLISVLASYLIACAKNQNINSR